eukprot:scaffold5733_cov57-Phaeocystis_antarctica.AAC.2
MPRISPEAARCHQGPHTSGACRQAAVRRLTRLTYTLAVSPPLPAAPTKPMARTIDMLVTSAENSRTRGQSAIGKRQQRASRAIGNARSAGQR